MLYPGLAPFAGGEERREPGQPLLGAGDQVVRLERIGELPQGLWIAATQEGVGEGLEADALFPQAICQPSVLIQIDAGGEGEVRTDAHEHPSPVAILEVEVVLIDPARLVLQMPLLGRLLGDADENPSRLSRLQDDDDLV